MKKTLKIIATVLIIIVLIISIMFVCDRATIDNQYKINEKNLLIPILIYHDIVESEEQIQYDYMQTTYETFKKQITGLIDYGYKPITYKDLIEYSKGEKALYKKSFIITFDDGYEGVYKYAPGTPFIRTVEGVATETEEVDECAIQAVLYTITTADETLDGSNIDSDDERIVARARLEDGTAKSEWTEFDLNFTWKDDATYDAEKTYKLAIICSSSKDGANFNGAANSTLIVDNLEVIGE